MCFARDLADTARPLSYHVITKKIYTMDYTENMHKVGDWVHTQDGVGIITNVFPVYQQYWDEEQELKERNEGLFNDDPETENRIFGEVPKTGEWIKDLITVKRLCNHDLEPLSRSMCFSTMAYANDKITQKEMREVNKILKDTKIKNRFEKYKCKFHEESRAWKTLIPPQKAVQIKRSLDALEGNNENNLKITMKKIESYLKNEFDVDIFDRGYPNNAIIHTRTLLRNNPEFYNKDREIVFCQLSIFKQSYSSDSYMDIIKRKNIDESLFDEKEWEKHGWNGEERGY